ncbi:glycosyltransferase [Halobellus sp. Atlit-31R]|nr:glycosyltransferase [Halobellus sp. Atlit-31R]
MMEIGFIGSLDFGTHSGARTRATRIYSLLSDHHDVTFLNVNTVNESPIPEGIAGRDLALQPEWLPHTGRELIAGYRAVTIASKYDFDIVWAYNSFQHTPLISYATARYLDVPLVVGVNDHRHGQGLKGTLINEIARSYILNHTDVLVFESDTLHRNLDQYGITPRQSVVVPTGINIDEYYRPHVPLAEDPVVFYVGRDKDLDLLLDAASIVQKDYPNVTFRLAGVDADAHPKYANKSFIDFLGFVPEEDLQTEMSRAHVCTVPYRNADTAGRPVKILEYMSAAKCIVATDLLFNTQMLSDGKNAVVADADYESFAEGILTVLSDSDKRDHLANQAREEVQAYSLEQMKKNLDEVIRLLTEG